MTGFGDVACTFGNEVRVVIEQMPKMQVRIDNRQVRLEDWLRGGFCKEGLVGLIQRRHGEIMLRGIDLIPLPAHKVAWNGIGYVPEERGIFSTLSVEENLYLPPTVAAGGLTVEQIFEMFPNLQERRNSGGGMLSGWEQQMLAIARILRTGARVLLMDEPTEGLAPVIVQRIGDLLIKLKELGYTILLVEQNFRFAAKVADRFYVLETGKTVDTLTKADVDARPGAFRAFLEV